MASILEAFKEDSYQVGPLQVIEYNRHRTELFKDGYLGDLYFRLRGNRFSNRGGNGVLEALFCGMDDLSYDKIVSYFAARPLLILGEWQNTVPKGNPFGVEEHFEPAGVLFPATTIGNAATEKSVIIGYTFFRPYWGKPEAEVLGMLGLAYFFVELNVQAILGMRYDSNSLTARFVRVYGTKDVGWIPKFMVRNGKLVDAVVSCLLKEDFEAYVERQLLEAFRSEHVQTEAVPESEEPLLLFPDIP